MRLALTGALGALLFLGCASRPETSRLDRPRLPAGGVDAGKDSVDQDAGVVMTARASCIEASDEELDACIRRLTASLTPSNDPRIRREQFRRSQNESAVIVLERVCSGRHHRPSCDLVYEMNRADKRAEILDVNDKCHAGDQDACAWLAFAELEWVYDCMWIDDGDHLIEDSCTGNGARHGFRRAQKLCKKGVTKACDHARSYARSPVLREP